MRDKLGPSTSKRCPVRNRRFVSAGPVFWACRLKGGAQETRRSPGRGCRYVTRWELGPTGMSALFHP